jgi:hypothetical protein
MVKLCDWVKKTRKEACEECSSVVDLRVLRSGKTLCKFCYYRYHNKNKPKKVSGKPKERPLTPNSKRARLWVEIERLRSLVGEPNV